MKATYGNHRIPDHGRRAGAQIVSVKNLLESAASNGSFETFGRAVEQAGLAETLNAPGPFTVFAPTDAAFDKLETGRLDDLFMPENRQELVSVLTYHVISGRKRLAELGKWDAARTLHGQMTPITNVGDRVRIDGAAVTAADIDSSNGYLHGIDKVNLPTRQ